MFPLLYGSIYKTPEDYKPPDGSNIATNTEYPNLNSTDYTNRPSNRTLRIHPAIEHIALSSENQITIATNKYCGREWNGTFFGFEDDSLWEENFDGLISVSSDKACFKLQCNSLISSLQYVADNILLVAFHSGFLQVWSTRSEIRNPVNPYCLFLIGEKSEHQKPITCMDVMKLDSNRAITGGKDCTVKTWDMGKADLFSLSTYTFAHSDVVTGVASSRIDRSNFATCSLDKASLLWDDRLPRPATAIYDSHVVRFHTVTWASTCTYKVFIGDELGKMHALDIRVPNKFENTKSVFEQPIRKIFTHGSKVAVIGDCNIIKVFDDSLALLYKNCEAENLIRDAIWKQQNQIVTVGFNYEMMSHNVNQ